MKIQNLSITDLTEAATIYKEAFNIPDNSPAIDILKKLYETLPNFWYKAIQDDTIIGIGSAFDCHKFAVAGFFAVRKNARGLGAAKSILSILDQNFQNNKPLLLYASDDGFPVYKKYGFTEIESVNRYRIIDFVKPNISLKNMNLIEYQHSMQQELYEFDRKYFCGCREHILKNVILPTSLKILIAIKNHQIVGYIAVNKLTIGPIVALSDEIASVLLGELSQRTNIHSKMILVPESKLKLLETIVPNATLIKKCIYMHLNGEQYANRHNNIFALFNFATG